MLSASTNLLSQLTPMTFDDADEKMTRDEIEYMLTKAKKLWMLMNRDVAGDFLTG